MAEEGRTGAAAEVSTLLFRDQQQPAAPYARCCSAQQQRTAAAHAAPLQSAVASHEHPFRTASTQLLASGLQPNKQQALMPEHGRTGCHWVLQPSTRSCHSADNPASCLYQGM
jgi:hypothetical protein